MTPIYYIPHYRNPKKGGNPKPQTLNPNLANSPNQPYRLLSGHACGRIRAVVAHHAAKDRKGILCRTPDFLFLHVFIIVIILIICISTVTSIIMITFIIPTITVRII